MAARVDHITAKREPRRISGVATRNWVRSHQLIAFFALTFALSWSLWLFAWLTGDGPIALSLFLLGGFGPPGAAALITWYSGDSVRDWAKQIVHWRVPGRFYLYALGLPAAIWTVINVQLAFVSDDFELSLLPQRLLVSVGTFLVVLTVGGGFEEPGWRGFALPRLQERYTPLKATLILGFMWGAWHIPVFGPLAPPFIMLLAFFYTYLFNKTRSVLLAILLHASFTPASDNFALVPRGIHGVADVVIFGTVLAAVIVLIVLTGGQLGLPRRTAQLSRR